MKRWIYMLICSLIGFYYGGTVGGAIGVVAFLILEDLEK